MSNLRPENRALFRAGRASFEPTEDDRARVGEAIGLRLGGLALGTTVTAAVGTTSTSAAATTVTAGAVATTAAVAASSAPPAVVSGAAVSSVLAVKWLAALAIVATVSVGGGVTWQRAVAGHADDPHAGPRSPAPVARPFESEARSSVSNVAPVALSDSAGKSEPPAFGVSGVASPTTPGTPTAARPMGDEAHPGARVRVLEARSAAEPVEKASNPASTAPPTEPINREVSVAHEARLLRDAEAALRAGDTHLAGARLDEHARVFPQGVLAEERDAERVLLYCESGDVAAAREAATRFSVEHPESPLRERVKSSCAAR